MLRLEFAYGRGGETFEWTEYPEPFSKKAVKEVLREEMKDWREAEGVEAYEEGVQERLDDLEEMEEVDGKGCLIDNEDEQLSIFGPSKGECALAYISWVEQQKRGF